MPDMAKTMIFGVLIKAFGFVIDESRAKAYLPS
jgi:hypothetical protein